MVPGVSNATSILPCLGWQRSCQLTLYHPPSVPPGDHKIPLLPPSPHKCNILPSPTMPTKTTAMEKQMDGTNVGGLLMDLVEDESEDGTSTPATNEASMILPTSVEKEAGTIPPTRKRPVRPQRWLLILSRRAPQSPTGLPLPAGKVAVLTMTPKIKDSWAAF